jgi:hypothetical protein
MIKFLGDINLIDSQVLLQRISSYNADKSAGCIIPISWIPLKTPQLKVLLLSLPGLWVKGLPLMSSLVDISLR